MNRKMQVDEEEDEEDEFQKWMTQNKMRQVMDEKEDVGLLSLQFAWSFI